VIEVWLSQSTMFLFLSIMVFLRTRLSWTRTYNIHGIQYHTSRIQYTISYYTIYTVYNIILTGQDTPSTLVTHTY
jgi:hypothetical protein